MIVGGKLNVFENFRRAKPRPTQSISIGVDGATYLANDGMLATLNTRRVQLITPWYRLWWLWLVSLFVRPMSVADFFAAVSDSQQELKLLKERGAGYEAAIAKAKANGQEALTEKLVTGFRAYKKESQLLAIGMPKFVEEDDIVRFVKQSKRGLRLDWLKHFTRQIPDSVLASKLKADRREIFDNYVVLHYDPEDKGNDKTTAEKRDPILFGVIEGKRRLYFVDHWIDEYCDLTLDQIADALGKDAVQEITDANEAASPYRA